MSAERPDSGAKPLRDFEVLLARAGQGCQDAKLALFQQYGRHLLRIIRQKLRGASRLRSIYDSDEFVQDVGKVFFGEELPTWIFESPQALIGFLVAVAKNRVAEVVRKHLQTEKSNLNREVPLDAPGGRTDQDQRGQEPTAHEVCAAKEEWEGVTRDLKPVEAYIVHLLRSGHTYQAIARNLDVEVSTVDRFVAKLKMRGRLPPVS